MARATLDLFIPVISSPWFSRPGIHLRRAVPTGPESGVRRTIDGTDVRLYIITEAIEAPRGSDLVFARVVRAVAEALDTDDELLKLFQAATPVEGARRSELQQRLHQQVGFPTWTKMLRAYNDFVEHLRADRAQFWLLTHPLDNHPAGYFEQLRPAVRFEGLARHPWPTPIPAAWAVSGGRGGDVFAGDWPVLQERMASGKRPDRVGTMLTNADELQSVGHLRSAVVEAVAALEAVISELPEGPEALRRWKKVADGRILDESLAGARKKLGTGHSLRILVPLLFTEEEVPVALINRCIEAYEKRNNIVHNRHVPVDRSEVWNLITDVRRMCDFLRGNPPGSPGGWSNLRPAPANDSSAGSDEGATS